MTAPLSRPTASASQPHAGSTSAETTASPAAGRADTRPPSRIDTWAPVVRPFCPGTLEANSDLRLCGMAKGNDADTQLEIAQAPSSAARQTPAAAGVWVQSPPIEDTVTRAISTQTAPGRIAAAACPSTSPRALDRSAYAVMCSHRPEPSTPNWLADCEPAMSDPRITPNTASPPAAPLNTTSGQNTAMNSTISHGSRRMGSRQDSTASRRATSRAIAAVPVAEPADADNVEAPAPPDSEVDDTVVSRTCRARPHHHQTNPSATSAITSPRAAAPYCPVASR